MPHSLFSRWRYSTRILFSGCDEATYQQDLIVHRTAGRDYEETVGTGLSSLKIWHIFIGSKCRPDYGDLRISDRYGRELAYYLWPDYDAESARVCVRLEGADAAGAVTVHYGNPSATTTSDPNATYGLWCDFLDAGEVAAVFDVVGTPDTTYANSVATITCNAREFYRSKKTFSRPARVEFRMADTGYGANQYPSSTGFGVRNQGGGGYHVIREAMTTAQYGLLSCNGGTTAISNGFSHDLTFQKYRIDWASGTSAALLKDDAVLASLSSQIPTGPLPVTFGRFHYVYSGNQMKIDWILVRAYSATPPSFLRTSREINLSYAGLARLTGSAAADDGVIQFAGVGSIRVVGDEREIFAGAGSFAVETSVRSPITAAGTAGVKASLNLRPPVAIPGVGGIASEPARLHTPLDMESGEGSAYVAPAPVQFDVWQYRFESLDISRSAQDALWRCDGQIDGLQAPLAYKSFTVRVPDHNGVIRAIFFGFVPGRDYVQAVAANKSTVQGFDAGFYLTRQYLPDGDLYYPARFLWTPMNLIKYWLGEEATWAGSPSRWEQVTGIMPYRIHNPSTYDHPYTPKDWNFQPKTTKAQAIQEVCEYSGMVFLVKWRSVNGAMTPCAYLVHQDDIDHATHGLDLPAMVTFTHPDPRIANGVRATLQSDEKYNRIEVRSASPSGAWFHAVRETAALQAGEELPIEYLEERSDLPIDADHGGWCAARADELYAYYTAYAYTYTLTLIDRTDLELYQRCRFYGFGVIPDGDVMRIVAIRYNVRPTHTEVEIVVTPDSRLSDIRRLQRSQAADAVSEMQVIARSQIEGLAAGEIGTVIEIDGGEAVVELERKAGSTMRGRIIT